jgi:hypothetical protein
MNTDRAALIPWLAKHFRDLSLLAQCYVIHDLSPFRDGRAAKALKPEHEGR